MISIWAYKKCVIFKDIFPGLSRFWNFKKKFATFQETWKPCLLHYEYRTNFISVQEIHILLTYILTPECNDNHI